MIYALEHSLYMTLRHLRNLARQPWWIAISLVQPIIWLLIFGALFKRIVEIPGFGADSYMTFLTPGIVVMSALFSGGWNGMSVIEDLDRGVLDRFLVSPVSRSALMVGRIVQQALVTTVQSVILVTLALVAGARFPGGVTGVVVLIGSAVLLGSAFGSLSNALALLLRRQESVIAAVQFVLLPLTFLSSAFLQQNLAPEWIQNVARFNPANWTVQAGREALGANVDWMLVLSYTGYLLIFAIVSAMLATRAFRIYQHSV